MNEPRLCEDCGTKLTPDARACPTCGLNLEAQAEWEQRVAGPMAESSFPLPPEHALSPDEPERVAPGGLVLRFAAWFLDSLIVGALSYGLLIAALIVLDTAGIFQIEFLDTERPPASFVSGMLFTFTVVPWLYFAGLESSSMAATIGKKMVGLRVVDSACKPVGFGRASARHFAKMLGFVSIGLGFLMAGFTDRRQALHDLVAKTLVLEA